MPLSSLLPLLLILLLPTVYSATCPAAAATTTTALSHYTTCTQLPTLSATLHHTYTPSNHTLSVAFTAAPPTPSGWVSWALNPTSAGMVGSQAFFAFKSPSSAAVTVSTFNLSSYAAISPSNLSFPVYSHRAVFNGDDGSFTIFAAVMSPAGGKVNHVWQVGSSVTDGVPDKHAMGSANLASKGTLDVGATAAPAAHVSSGGGSGLRKRNIHGVLNAVSWGLLFPFGAIISRYLRTFESADPTWFYLHAICQTSAYAIGVAGWATGLQLGTMSKGIVFETHRCIGIALFSLATLQVFALFLRPKNDHKYRFYWNIYHHSIGYAIIILGIINVFKGLDILEPEKKWRSIYVTTLIVLGGIAVLLEALTWVVVLRRKSSRSTKPYA
ncbi:hypothetical protein vseg_003959 [Gypsophila vaccaria]